MNEREEIFNTLMEVTGGEICCGISCDREDVIFKDEEGWKLFLEGFMEPWHLGDTADEAKKSIKEYASQGFGLG